jgi:hypothetical protein
MKKQIDVKDAEKFEKIKNILLEYFEKKAIGYFKGDTMILCPLGIILKEGKLWVFSPDYTYIDNVEESLIHYQSHAFPVIEDLTKLLKTIYFDRGHYNIFNDSKQYVGTLYVEEIIDYMEKNKYVFSMAKQLLSATLVVEFEEEEEAKKKREEDKKIKKTNKKA